jgi:hypothetical protein
MGWLDWLEDRWKHYTRPSLRLRWVDEEPDLPQLGILYLVGTPAVPKWAVFECPCGCKERIDLYLGNLRRPNWSVSVSRRGRATLVPSVWQTGGCGAHFLVRDGRVDFV